MSNPKVPGYFKSNLGDVLLF